MDTPPARMRNRNLAPEKLPPPLTIHIYRLPALTAPIFFV